MHKSTDSLNHLIEENTLKLTLKSIDNKKIDIIDNTLSFQPLLTLDSTYMSNAIPVKPDICLYIHIPFCAKKCFFCSIDTCQSFSIQIIDDYMEALVKEIEYRTDLLLNFNIICVHFGGGTPSIMSMFHLKKIFKALKRCLPYLHETEVVFEANPMSLNIDQVSFIASCAKLSLNIGIQTFEEKILDCINRSVNKGKILSMLAKITQMNLYTLGIDLICNLPLSNQETTINDIDTALGLGINHFAIYPLRIESNSTMHSNYNLFYNQLPSDSLQLEAFDNAKRHLINNGFEHYSIFHFNGTKYANHLYSRRQSIGGEWIGFGAGANSYYRSQVFDNTSNIVKYINAQKAGLNCIETSKSLRLIDIIIRELVYSLRNSEINKKYYLDRYSQQIYNPFAESLRMLQKDNYIQEFDHKFELTTCGIFNLASIEKVLFNYLG